MNKHQTRAEIQNGQAIGGENQRSQPKFGGLVPYLSLKLRRRMFQKILKMISSSPKIKILDVGVTSDERPDSNFFEKLYPFPGNITAVSLEDASFLERDFPGLKFMMADAKELPFPDKSFDLAVSFALIEHLGSRENQRAFLREVCRVGRVCLITAPNRWFPIEFHTVLPLLHWLPLSVFRKILSWIGQDFFSREENLNLFGEKEFISLFPEGFTIEKSYFRLFGFISNFLFFVKPKES